MPVTSTRLGLAKPVTSDSFTTAGLSSNLQILDTFPGIYICTSSTRPTWGANQAGMRIYETDTDTEWRWTGSVWVRVRPRGWLGGNKRTGDYADGSGVFGVVVQQASIVVPAGSLHVEITASWWKIVIPGGESAEMALYRGATQLVAWQPFGSGGAFAFTEQPAPGTYTYSLQFRGIGATGSTLKADATHPCSIDLKET